MIEILIRRLPAEAGSVNDSPTVFHISEPDEVVGESSLYRVRLAGVIEAERSGRSPSLASSHKEASESLLRMVYGILGHLLGEMGPTR